MSWTLCREAGVQLLISCTDENPGQESVVVNNMIARQVDGLIVASCMHNDADYLKLSEQLPVVLFDRSQRQRPAAGDDRLDHPNGRTDLPHRASACG
jgi:DNA-binding LacI/PurR family transcriptional regulator